MGVVLALRQAVEEGTICCFEWVVGSIVRWGLWESNCLLFFSSLD